MTTLASMTLPSADGALILSLTTIRPIPRTVTGSLLHFDLIIHKIYWQPLPEYDAYIGIRPFF